MRTAPAMAALAALDWADMVMAPACGRPQGQHCGAVKTCQECRNNEVRGELARERVTLRR
jgi:hypothetical protein